MIGTLSYFQIGMMWALLFAFFGFGYWLYCYSNEDDTKSPHKQFKDQVNALFNESLRGKQNDK